jgi:hypothetical protein
MKPDKIISSRENRNEGEVVGASLTKLHYKHVQKCHNESPLTTNIYKNMFKKRKDK